MRENVRHDDMVADVFAAHVRAALDLEVEVAVVVDGLVLVSLLINGVPATVEQLSELVARGLLRFAPADFPPHPVSGPALEEREERDLIERASRGAPGAGSGGPP